MSNLRTMKNLKITVFDGFMAAREDLNWDALREFGDVSEYDRTPNELVIERSIDADVLLVNKVPLFKEQLSLLPKLKYIGVTATGYNNVDLSEARARGIDVTNIPSYSTESVAQAVFAHILNLSNAVESHSEAVRSGLWCKSADICFCLRPLVELCGRRLGIIGYGAIGSRVAQIAKAFGMDVWAYSPSKEGAGCDGVAQFKSVDEIFSNCHIISLNCPFNPATDKIVNAKSISLCMDGVWFINTGRGALVDERAMAEALALGKVGGYGADVLSAEPPSADNPLLGAPNCHLTPHNAWTTKEARRRLIEIAADNLRAWIAGTPKNIVN